MTKPLTLEQLRFAQADTVLRGRRLTPKTAEERTVNISATVLPAHRDWLRGQADGASGAIRRLVERAIAEELASAFD